MQVLPAMEIVFASIFTVELLMRCIAHGIPAYWADDWNKLDAAIVVVSWVSILGDMVINVSSLRAIRVFRVFRLLTAFDGLKELVQLCFQVQLFALTKVQCTAIQFTLLSVQVVLHKQLALVLLMSLIVFLIYSCIGLHLWSGDLLLI